MQGEHTSFTLGGEGAPPSMVRVPAEEIALADDLWITVALSDGLSISAVTGDPVAARRPLKVRAWTAGSTRANVFGAVSPVTCELRRRGCEGLKAVVTVKIPNRAVLRRVVTLDDEGAFLVQVSTPRRLRSMRVSVVVAAVKNASTGGSRTHKLRR